MFLTGAGGPGPSAVRTGPHVSSSTGQSEIEQACELLFRRAECVDYRYDVQDPTVEGLLILPLYGSMASGTRPPASSPRRHVEVLP